MCMFFFFFFQAEDGIRDAQESRGLGDVYKRQLVFLGSRRNRDLDRIIKFVADKGLAYGRCTGNLGQLDIRLCLLYTSDAADDLLCVDLGGRRIIKKKNKKILDFDTFENQSNILLHILLINAL